MANDEHKTRLESLKPPAPSPAEKTRARPSRHRHRFSSAQRIHDPADFQRAYAGRKVHTPPVIIFVCRNDLPWSRLGVSVGSKHGNAVKRNRIKRVLRAAFRECRAALPPGLDYVLVPRRGVARWCAAEVKAALLRVAGKLSAV